MFIALSHLAGYAASPLTWAILLLCGASVLAALRDPGRQRLAALPALLALLVLAVFSSPRASNALFRSLERGASATPLPARGEPYDAVIVLSGLLDAEATESAGAPGYTDAVERLHAGFEILRSGRAREALLSGGSVDPRIHQAVEARVLSRQLQAWGIDGARIVIEDQSRNTRENAVYSARIVRARGWKRLLLVTSAFHMERAAGAFRAAGVPAFDTLPVDFRSHDPARFPQGWLPRAESLAQSTLALHEWVGRFAYRARGYASP